MRLSVVIVSRQEKAHVRRCVGSLWQHCRTIRPEVIVIDRGSDDGCRTMLAEEFPSVTVVRSESNSSLAAANNLGVKHAGGSHLLFLHPQTELIEDSLAILLQCMDERSHVGAMGCALLNPDRTVHMEGVRSFPTITNQVFDSEYLRERFPDSALWGQRALHAKWPRQAQVEVVSGICLLVRRSCFEEVGGCSELFGSQGWEADLCYRIRQSGAAVYYVPETSVVFGGRNGPDPLRAVSNVVVRESIFRFMNLHYGRFHAVGYRVSMAITAVVRLVLIPLMMPLGNVVVRHGRGSWNKWVTILRWSLARSGRL